MGDTISDSAHVMAELARRDPRITLGDVVDQMQAEVALLNWAQGTVFDRDAAQQALLRHHPHLQATVP